MAGKQLETAISFRILPHNGMALVSNCDAGRRAEWAPGGYKEKIPRTGRHAGFQILGWLMGLEPTTTGITILDSTN
jgi:hypothetical protein